MNPKEELRDLRRKLNRERKKIGLLELKIHALRLEKRILREALDRKEAVKEAAQEPAKAEFSDWVLSLASDPFDYLQVESYVRSRRAGAMFDFACSQCNEAAFHACRAYRSSGEITDTHKPRADACLVQVLKARDKA
jgi:hypothetical protein